MQRELTENIGAEFEEVMRRLVDAYQPERIYLFGSFARDEATEDSDYDLLVLVPDSAGPEQRRSGLAYKRCSGVPEPQRTLL